MKLRKNPELRKKELTDIAFSHFLQYGYEKTSIRSIVAQANGEIGMFYNYFSSKEELFEIVLQRYNEEYVNKIRDIISNNKDMKFRELFKLLFSFLADSINEYQRINDNMANAQVLMQLHQSTLISLCPIFHQLLIDYINRGEIPKQQINTALLNDFLLFGISGVIHNKSEKSREAKYDTLIYILNTLFNI